MAEHIDLQKTVYQAIIHVAPEMVHGSTVTVRKHVGFMADDLVVQMRQVVWSRHVGDHVVRFPADWWQAFKRRFFPQWALSRWPVLETTVVVTAYHDYPGVAIQGREPLLHYRQQTREADEGPL